MLFSGEIYESVSLKDWIDTLSPSFISIYFLIFVAILLMVYYIIPQRVRWTVLLAGSLLFYGLVCFEALPILVLSVGIVYLVGICIDVTPREFKKKRRVFVMIGIAVLLAMLIYCKLYGFFEPDYPFVIPLGISYYTFSAISYLIDINRGKDSAEYNYFKLLLFLSFFPKILQGPISRHNFLGKQFVTESRLSYKKFVYGFQLAIYGYFKKMAIADRVSIFTSSIIENHQSMGGAILLLMLLLAAVQLYCDFSGCVDIASGISYMFGIEIERNFNHPFFSKSAAEFWRRWHITLGTWFKDYVYMPIVTSKWMMKIVSKGGQKFGKSFGKNIMVIIPLLIVWILTGLWHGTGLNYVVWGIYWGIIIITSTLLAKQYKLIVQKCKIDVSSKKWQLFQMIRTFLLFCIGRLISVPGDLKISWQWITKIITDIRPWQLFDGTIYNQGLDWREYVLMWLFIAVLLGISCIQEVLWKRNTSIREVLMSQNMVLACLINVVAILIILVYGVYGPGYDSSGFIYMNY